MLYFICVYKYVCVCMYVCKTREFMCLSGLEEEVSIWGKGIKSHSLTCLH